MGKWTPEEITFLKENYDKLETKILASKLNRTIAVIHQKVSDEKLTNFMKTKFEIIPSPELSYLLGVRYGDAKFDKKGYSFGLEAKDRDFLEEFVKCIYKVTGKKIKIWRNKRKYFLSKLGSKKLFEFMMLPLKEHKLFIEKYPIDFIRGFFDSEGCIGIYKDKRKKNTYDRKLSMCCTNREIILFCQKLLKEMDITLHLYLRQEENRKKLYKLEIEKKDEIMHFWEKINPTIKRKREIFCKL